MLKIKILKENKAEIIVDAVNSVVSSLPYGHKWRNSTYANKLLKQIAEELQDKDLVTEEELDFLIKKFTNSIGII
jgi:hypothetical protein